MLGVLTLLGPGEHKEQPQFPPPTTPQGSLAASWSCWGHQDADDIPQNAPLAACQAPFWQRALEMWKNTKSARCQDPPHTPRGARSPRFALHPCSLFPPDPRGELWGRSPSRSSAPKTHRDMAGHVGLSPHGPNAGFPPLPVLNPWRQHPAGGQGPISQFPPVFGVPSRSEETPRTESSARPGPAASSSPDFDAVLINIYLFFLNQS